MKVDKYFIDERVLLKDKNRYSVHSGIIKDVAEKYFSVEWDNSTSLCWHEIKNYEVIEQLERRNYNGS